MKHTDSNSSSLRRWFPVKTESQAKMCVPSILYLHCNTNSYVEAKWYYGKTIETFDYPIHTHHTIVWNIQGRKGTPLNITIACGELPQDVDTVSNPKYQLSCRLNENASSIPFLKSHLQKNIRKGNAGLAVRTCKEMLQQDVLQVVRRLSIIMVEDVDLHPAFNILMWWTIALTKQADNIAVLRADDVPSSLLEWLLGLTHMLCRIKHRTVFDTSTPPHHTIWQHAQNLHKLRTHQHPPSFLNRAMQNTLWSVMVRASYGGLKGDMRLLQSVVSVYIQKVNANTNTNALWMTTVRPVVYHSVEPLDASTWDLDAIDFHVARYFVQKLEEAVNDESIDVKRMMWENGSSVNVRDAGGDEKYAGDVWRKVLPSVREWQSYLLSK